MSRLPVLPPVAPVEHGDYEIYYQDKDPNGVLGEKKQREILTLVTERTARRIAEAWQLASWVRGRVYGYRKVEGAGR